MKLAEVADIKTGLTQRKPYLQGDPNLRDTFALVDSIKTGQLTTNIVTFNLPEKVRDRISVQPNDLLLTTKFRHQCPAYWVGPNPPKNLIASQMTLIVRSRSLAADDRTTKMLFCFLASQEGQSRLYQAAREVNFKDPNQSPLRNLTIKELKTLDIPEPQEWNTVIETWKAQQLRRLAAEIERIQMF